MNDNRNPFAPNDGDPVMDGPATDDLEGADRDVADETRDGDRPARVRTGDEGEKEEDD